MLYHESLPAVVDEALKAGIDFATAGIIRDGAGRLLVAATELPNKKALEEALKARLGAYASPIPVATGEVAKRILSGASAARDVLVDGQVYQIRYFDRRIVGSDWLQQPLTSSDRAVPRLIFGSLKGGVGRSTAMAVLCADLARAGKRVLAVDLDIEAPGIGFMLLPEAPEQPEDRRPRYGTIDYLVENGLGGISVENIGDFIGLSPYIRGQADVVPAVGRITDDHPHLMMEKLSRALVEDLSDRRKSVLDQVREMVEVLASRDAYDVILIDARAGLGEISAAPMLGLGGEVILFATDQAQTFRGYRYLLAHMRQNFSMSDEGDWRQKLHFVQAKAPSASSRRSAFRERLYDICAEFLYDEERLDGRGEVVRGPFNPSPAETGLSVPHDATHIEYHPNYDAFDPSADETQLNQEVYRGPYGVFLEWAWGLLGFSREKGAPVAD